MKLWLKILFFYWLGTQLCSACAFTTDCSPGSTCMKAPGSIYGVCAGGLFPGNDHDLQPTHNAINPSSGQGNTCSFDTECGAGHECYKPQNNVYGVCL